MSKLTEAQRAAIAQEISALTEDALALERKAQRLQRVLDRDDFEAERRALQTGGGE